MQTDNAGSGFEGVEISAGDMAGIYTAEPDTGAEVRETPEEKDPKDGAGQSGDGTGEGSPAKIKVRDAEYTEEELAAAVEDARNKETWVKRQTEEAQKLAAMRKMVEPVAAFVEKLKADGEFAADIRDAAVERFGDEFAGVIDAVIQFDAEKAPNPFKAELDAKDAELRDLRASIEGEKAIAAELKGLRESHKLSEEAVLAVLEFAGKKFEETGQALPLEDAFKLMDYENVKKKAEERKGPAIPDVPGNSRGAKDIKAKKPGSYDEISTEGYNLLSS